MKRHSHEKVKGPQSNNKTEHVFFSVHISDGLFEFLWVFSFFYPPKNMCQILCIFDMCFS